MGGITGSKTECIKDPSRWVFEGNYYYFKVGLNGKEEKFGKNILQISEMEITAPNMPLTPNYKSLSKSQVEAQSKSKVLKV